MLWYRQQRSDDITWLPDDIDVDWYPHVVTWYPWIMKWQPHGMRIGIHHLPGCDIFTLSTSYGCHVVLCGWKIWREQISVRGILDWGYCWVLSTVAFWHFNGYNLIDGWMNNNHHSICDQFQRFAVSKGYLHLQRICGFIGYFWRVYNIFLLCYLAKLTSKRLKL